MTVRPGIEQFNINAASDRAAWLALRSQDVTASVAGALLGVHEYETAYGLWAAKSGLIPQEDGESGPMRRGRLLEPVAVALLAEERPTWTLTPGASYYRDPATRIGATPDCFAVDPAREGFGVVQIKSVESSIFRRKWKQEDGTVEPPLWIAVQALVEADLTGASWACVTPLVVGFGLDLPVIEIPLTPGIMDRLKEVVAEFWRRVDTKDPPDVDYARDGALLAQLYRDDDGSTVDLSGWNAGPVIAEEDARLAAEIKERKARRDAIKAEIIDKIGAAAVAMIDGEIFATARTVNRKPYAVAASSYRDIRIKKGFSK
jgi:hypothetical protein